MHCRDTLLAFGMGRDGAECALWRQVVMAVFSYLYFNSYVAREVSVTVGSVLQVRHKPHRAECACRDTLRKISCPRPCHSARAGINRQQVLCG